MHKLLSALVAILSFASVLCGVTAGPVTAQDRPTVAGQDGSFPHPARPGEAEPMIVPAGVMHENVEVHGRPLIIEGDVKGSVHAVNSRVTLMPGAMVEGTLTVEGGSLSVAKGATGLMQSYAPAGVAGSRGNLRTGKRGDWFNGQFFLWLLGLAGSVIVLVAAPNATSRVAETISMRPGRSLLAGLVTTAAMLSALAVSGVIMSTRSFFSILWMPVLVVVALVSLVFLVFGWLAGMRRVGDLLARRFGQIGGGSFYGRTALGLTAFFLVNALLGALNPALGAVSLLVEFAIALMGIGAIVESGFGRDDQWLDRRLRRASGPDVG